LDDQNEAADFERRAKIAELMLQEREIDSNERIAEMQTEAKRKEAKANSDYMTQASQMM
jgi:hypothetical protein